MANEQQPVSSNKRRSSTTPAASVVRVEPCGSDCNKSSPTNSSYTGTRNSASLPKHTHSKKRKRLALQQQQLLTGRRLAVPLVTFLLLFIWVLGIAALCQHRRNLMTTTFARSIGQTGQGSFLLRRRHRHHGPLLWNNKNNNNGLVHVIQTRFMQYQGHLLQLGRARLKLFEAITLPSVVHQTTTSSFFDNDDGPFFVWIIRTDPNLAPELRARLIQLVEPYDFIVLVGSNENPEGFRAPDCIADMMPPTNATRTTTTITNRNPIWSGRLETVRSYHQAAQSHPVLETRLDADDGLLLDFVQLIQADAARRFFQKDDNNNNNNSNNGDWMVWCAKIHMEWQYASPWKTTNADKNADDTDDQGGLVGLKSNHCVTAGLTFGYGVGSSPTQIPSHKHQQLHEAIPACDTTAAAATTTSKQAIRTTRCLARIEPPGSLPATIRARTPTSAGMEHVLTGLDNFQGNKLYLEKVKGSGWKDSQHDLFHELPKLFGIQPFDLWNVRAHIKKHLPEILSDAIAGQCTRGHSCKEESKKLLQQLLEESTTN